MAAYQIPKLSQVVDRCTTDIAEAMIDSAVPLPRAVIRALGAVSGGLHFLLYGFLKWISDQIIPDLAEAESMLRWAKLFQVTKNPATYAKRQIAFTGTNGVVIPAGRELQRSDGVKYTVDADGTVSGGTVTVAITALTAGVGGNIDVGTKLSLLSPIAGLNSEGTIGSGGKIDAVDEETNESVLERYLEVLANPPEGGNEADYVRWAKEVSGVTRAWCLENWMGLGTVGIAFVRDDDEDSIIPGGAEVEEVEEYLETKRPVTAELFVIAPTAVAQNFNITISPNTAQVRAAVEAEIRDLWRRKSTAKGGTLRVSWVREAVSIAAGEENNVVNSPAADIVRVAGQISTVGTFTWS